MATTGFLRTGPVLALVMRVAMLWALALPALAAVTLAPEEQRWIDSAPEVVVAVQSDYPPFSFTDPGGAAAGYSNELFKLAAGKTGFASGSTRAAPGMTSSGGHGVAMSTY